MAGEDAALRRSTETTADASALGGVTVAGSTALDTVATGDHVNALLRGLDGGTGATLPRRWEAAGYGADDYFGGGGGGPGEAYRALGHDYGGYGGGGGGGGLDASLKSLSSISELTGLTGSVAPAPMVRCRRGAQEQESPYSRDGDDLLQEVVSELYRRGDAESHVGEIDMDAKQRGRKAAALPWSGGRSRDGEESTKSGSEVTPVMDNRTVNRLLWDRSAHGDDDDGEEEEDDDDGKVPTASPARRRYRELRRGLSLLRDGLAERAVRRSGSSGSAVPRVSEGDAGGGASSGADPARRGSAEARCVARRLRRLCSVPSGIRHDITWGGGRGGAGQRPRPGRRPLRRVGSSARRPSRVPPSALVRGAAAKRAVARPSQHSSGSGMPRINPLVWLQLFQRTQ